MTRQVSMEELEAGLSDIIGTVSRDEQPIIVARDGTPLAVLISPEQYKLYRQQAMERLRQVVEEWRQLNADIDPEEGFREITAIVEEVRQERYDREQQARSGDR